MGDAAGEVSEERLAEASVSSAPPDPTWLGREAAS